MGCCLSAGNHNPEAELASSIHGAPPMSPPGVIEDETVKEVLLETPLLVPEADDSIKAMPPGNRERKAAEATPTAVIHGNSVPQEKDKEGVVSEVSQESEMRSYSESFSNATAQEKKDEEEDGVVNQRLPPRKRRALSGGRGRGDRVLARRMAAPSMEKRDQVRPLTPVRGRPMAGQPRSVEDENGRMRSTSPVRRDEVDVRRDASDEKIPATGVSADDNVPAVAESLENPVVLLECFIFL